MWDIQCQFHSIFLFKLDFHGPLKSWYNGWQEKDKKNPHSQKYFLIVPET